MHSRRSYRSTSIERLSGTSETSPSLVAAAMLCTYRCSNAAELIIMQDRLAAEYSLAAAFNLTLHL